MNSQKFEPGILDIENQKNISKFNLGPQEELELSFQEFRGNFEKVISRFRIEAMKEMMKSKGILQKAAFQKLNNKKLEFQNQELLMQKKVILFHLNNWYYYQSIDVYKN